jgi:transcriptional regulator with XRE-family HTH domain
MDRRASRWGSHVTDSFGARLRRERERQRISIRSIAAATKIRASLFEQMERGDASQWPSGIFRRSFIRAYASAIGLDPDETVREFLEAFPDPAHPPAPKPAASSSARPQPAMLRLQLADAGDSADRWLALLVDVVGVVIPTLAASIVVGQLWMPFAIVMCVYFFAGTILTGATPGLHFLDRWHRRGHAPAPPRAAPASVTPFLIHSDRGHSLSLELSTQSTAASRQ